MSASSEQVVSPVDTEKPEFVISAQSINAEPVELDSTPTSPEKVRARRASRDELLAELGEKEKKKRDQLLVERKGNPAVLVDIPQTPGADEIKIAKARRNETPWSLGTEIQFPSNSSYGN